MWEYPWYFNVLSSISKHSKIKIGGQTVVDFGKIIFGNSPYWTEIKFGRKGIGITKDILDAIGKSQEYQYMQDAGYFGPEEYANKHNTAGILTAWEVEKIGIKNLPSTATMYGGVIGERNHNH